MREREDPAHRAGWVRAYLTGSVLPHPARSARHPLPHCGRGALRGWVLLPPPCFFRPAQSAPITGGLTRRYRCVRPSIIRPDSAPGEQNRHDTGQNRPSPAMRERVASGASLVRAEGERTAAPHPPIPLGWVAPFPHCGRGFSPPRHTPYIPLWDLIRPVREGARKQAADGEFASGVAPTAGSGRDRGR